MTCSRCGLDIPIETMQEAIEDLTAYFGRLPTATELQRELYDNGTEICMGECLDMLGEVE